MYAALLTLALAASSPFQAPHQHHTGDSIIVQRRLKLTALRPPSAADSARGEELVRTARAAVLKYRSVAAAEADGYRVFAPKLKGQKVLHYTNRVNALRNRTSFDATRPTALLYQPGPGGDLRLLGVMYTMPAGSSLDDLDRGIPLSLTAWHMHTNICRPARLSDDAVTAFTERRGFRHLTRDACEAAGGRFMSEGRNWMVHVNVMADDPAGPWDHRGHAPLAQGDAMPMH